MVKYAAKFRFSSQLFITSVLLVLLTTLPKTNSYKPIKCDDACLAKTTFTSKNGYEKTKALLQQGHNGTKWFHGDFKYYKKGQLNGNYSSYMHKKEIDELNYYLTQIEYSDQLSCTLFHIKTKAESSCYNKIIELLVAILIIILALIWSYFLCCKRRSKPIELTTIGFRISEIPAATANQCAMPWAQENGSSSSDVQLQRNT